MLNAFVERSSQVSVLPLLLLCCVLPLAGCEYRSNALEDRMKEFQYSTETLGNEMIGRLKTAHAGTSRKKQAENSRASQVSEMEAGRGGDGDRPDPNSAEVIAMDCAAKIRLIQSQGGDAGATEAIIKQIEAETEIKQDVRDVFSSTLREELAKASS